MFNLRKEAIAHGVAMMQHEGTTIKLKTWVNGVRHWRLTIGRANQEASPHHIWLARYLAGTPDGAGEGTRRHEGIWKNLVIEWITSEQPAQLALPVMEVT